MSYWLLIVPYYKGNVRSYNPEARPEQRRRIGSMVEHFG